MSPFIHKINDECKITHTEEQILSWRVRDSLRVIAPKLLFYALES